MSKIIKQENNLEQEKFLEDLQLDKNVKRKFEGAILVQLFKTSRAQGIPDTDFIKYIHMAQQTGANPTLSQIYLIPYRQWDSNTRQNKVVGQILFHYSFLETVAQQTGEYKGMKREIGIGDYFDPDTMEAKKMLFCKTIVKRGEAEFEYTAWFNEYAKRNKEDQLLSQWKSAPYLMLEKTSLAGALRRAFPEALSGIYAQEEQTLSDQELENDFQREVIETQAVEKKEKAEKILEHTKATDDRHEVIGQIRLELERVTEKYNKAEKVEAMKHYCKVNNFKELNKKELLELKEIYSHLKDN